MTEQAPDSIAAALAQLQTRLPKVTKGETARVKSDKGSYSYTYANLADISAQILPILGGLGLSFTARPTLSDGAFVLAYELLHVSGENRCGEYPLPTGGSPQALGSAITYGRRYCLCAVTGVAPDDDDDGAAAQAEWRSPDQRPEPQCDQPPPAETDETWAVDLGRRVDLADSVAQTRGLWAEVNAKVQAGQCSGFDANALKELITKRAKELKGETDAPAEQEATS